MQSRDGILLEGPICNSSQVLGWHVDDKKKRSQRFHAEMSGFAFNSTVIWDTKRWHRPTNEPIRQIETVKQDLQVSFRVPVHYATSRNRNNEPRYECLRDVVTYIVELKDAERKEKVEQFESSKMLIFFKASC